MNSSFPKVSLSEIVFIKGGKRLPTGSTLQPTLSKHPYIRIRDVGQRYLPRDGIQYVPDKVFDSISRYIVEENDVVLSIVGTIGSVSIVDRFYNLASLTENCVKLTGLDYHDALYLFYYLSSSTGQQEISKGTVGAVQPKLPIYNIEKIQVMWPSVKAERKRIAHILGTLDDKIENNRKTAKTLEAMAQAIFKSWFVDFDPVLAKMAGESRESICKRLKLTPEILDLFPDRLVDSELGEIPEGWEIGVLNDYIKSCLGGDWGSDCISSENNVAVRCVRGADIAALYTCSMAKMPIRYIKPSSYEKREIHTGDIVLEISGGSPTQSTGRSILITEELIHRSDLPLVTSNFCRSIQFRSIQQSLYASYILKHLYAKDEFLQYENGSTGIKNFAFTLFCSEHLMVLPASAILAFFETIVRNLQKRPAAIRAESDTIENIRDTLLPKLLSGEIRIPEAKFLIEEATG